MSKKPYELDFSEREIEKRLAQVEKIISSHPNLPPRELEFLSDFILWGIEPDGTSPSSYIHLKSRKFSTPPPTTSLDSLLFNLDSAAELLFLETPSSSAPPKPFSRPFIFKNAPPHLIPEFESLFSQIDSLSSQLASTLSPQSRRDLSSQLLSLRREQFKLRDEFITPFSAKNRPLNLLPHQSALDPPEPHFSLLSFTPNPPPSYQLPFNLLSPLIHNSTLPPFTSPPLSSLPNPSLSLSSPKTLSTLFSSSHFLPLYNSPSPFLSLLIYYLDLSNLSPLQLQILFLRALSSPTLTYTKIASLLPPSLSTFTPSYLSTIYRTQIIPTISSTITLHSLLISSPPSSFTLCRGTGPSPSPSLPSQSPHIDFRHPHFFTRRSASSTGFSPRCKECERTLKFWKTL